MTFTYHYKGESSYESHIHQSGCEFRVSDQCGGAPAGAALIDRGSFTDGFSGPVNLIYDTDLDITWLGDANFAKTSGFDADGQMTWATATNVWAPSLTVGGFTDWRLLTTM